MTFLMVNQAERYFCPYREGNCVPHECMAWKYADDDGGYCQMFDDSVPTNECVEPKPETILLTINGYDLAVRKPEALIHIVKSRDFVKIFIDGHDEAMIDRLEWESREKWEGA